MTHVLIVDDNASIRMAEQFILEDAGYHVAQAMDGREAYEILTADTQGVIVLLDLAMPGMDGQAFLEAIHQQPALAARHPIVIVSAHTDEMLPPRLCQIMNKLSVPVLDKPFSMDDLLAAVDRAAERLTENNDSPEIK